MKTILKNEGGFSLIELLMVVAILGILAQTIITNARTFKNKAEYAKATSTFGDSKSASTLISFENPDFSIPQTYSATTAGLLTGALGAALPGVVNSNFVRITYQVTACTATSNPLDLETTLNVEPCKANEQVRWQKFCGGIEVQFDHLANPTPCI